MSSLSLSTIADEASQIFYQEAIVWKRLEHQNIVPLLGITSNPLQLISEWMSGGDLTEYTRKHPEADPLGLVAVPPIVFDPTLTTATSCLTSLKAFTFSTSVI